LTLPGFDNVTRTGDPTSPGAIGNSVFLCRDGFDPMSAEAQGATVVPCIVASVEDYTTDAHDLMFDGTLITVGDRTAHVLGNVAGHAPRQATAWSDFDNGLTAVVVAPASAGLSADQLAELVTSIRLSPGAALDTTTSGN